MLQRALLKLDERQLPQKLVSWLLRRRKQSRLHSILTPKTRLEGAHAVSLTVANPLMSQQGLIEELMPRKFGAWRDFKVKTTAVSRQQAVAILADTRGGTEFTLVLPVQASFSERRFRSAKVLRLTCEAERAALLSVRDRDGRLLAAGVLESEERAAFSREVR
jgi:hypothetical protein